MNLCDRQLEKRRIRNLYSKGEIDSAIGALSALIAAHMDEPSADEHKLLSLYQFSNGDPAKAIKTLHKLDALKPDDAETLGNIALCLIRTGQQREGLGWLHRAARLTSDDANLHDGLAHAYGKLGQEEKARHHGETALRLKDAAVANVEPVCLPDNIAIAPFRSDASERNVIAFSLWGPKLRYTEGALRNARLASEIYPEWRCRFYCGSSVPEHVIGELIALGADIVSMPEGGPLFEGLFWRFRVAWDTGVDRFLVRDVDSLISLRERIAVDEWLGSDKHFHVLRDWYTHTDPILAGLWGGVGAVLPPLERHYASYLSDVCKTTNCDQKFLRDVIWPVARRSVMSHDSWFRALDAKPFPRNAAIAPGRHVGQDATFYPTAPFGRRVSFAGPQVETPSKPRQQFIFTLTTGRSGTAYLAELLRKNIRAAEVHHERVGFQDLGRLSPDASHFTIFNSKGNVASVQAFWRRKLGALRVGTSPVYAETSHFLAKAGLVENIALLGTDARVDLVVLRRSPKSLIWSFANRMDFANLGFTWLFALDPRYPRNIVDTAPFDRYGAMGHCYWYVVEMQARAEYYERLLTRNANLRFHKVRLEEIAAPEGAADLLGRLSSETTASHVSLPGRENRMRQELLGPRHRRLLEEMLDEINLDPIELAESYLRAGRRLGGLIE